MAISRESGVAFPVALGILQHAGIIEWRQFFRYREKVLDFIPEEVKNDRKSMGNCNSI